MPAKDRYHDALKRALVKDGWTIEDEQITLTIDERNFWIDLKASKAESQLVILVELKELAEVDSAVEALANALGKFELYKLALRASNISIPLHLAVSEQSFKGILSEKIGQIAIGHAKIPLVVFDSKREEIVRWIN